MQEAYKQAQKALLGLRKDVQDLVENPNAPVERERELASQLESLGATLAALAKSAPPAEAQREMWKQKISNATADQKMILTTLREACRKRDLLRAEEEHKKGLHDRRYNLDSVLLDNEYKVNESGTLPRGGRGSHSQQGQRQIRPTWWHNISRWGARPSKSSGGSEEFSMLCRAG
jgi:hypothetical protein